jgi:hypothetical protein
MIFAKAILILVIGFVFFLLNMLTLGSFFPFLGDSEIILFFIFFCSLGVVYHFIDTKQHQKLGLIMFVVFLIGCINLMYYLSHNQLIQGI